MAIKKEEKEVQKSFFTGPAYTVTVAVASPVTWLGCKRAALLNALQTDSISDGHQIVSEYFIAYAHRSQWSIGHLRPLAIALSSGLLWPFQTSLSLAVSALLQCLASNCCEADLSSSSPAGSRSGLGM